MDLNSFYSSIGVNGEDPLRRFGSPALLYKYLNRLLSDQTFDNLGSALEQGDCEQAFRAAHTLKGVALNLDLGPVSQISSQLSEALRHAQSIPPEAGPLYESLSISYRSILDQISLLEP